MKALTLHQPWAQLIALGVKTIETRSWATKYRGRLLIHAEKSVTFHHSWQFGDWRTYHGDPSTMYDRSVGWASRPETPIPLPLGAIVASCKLVDVVPIIGRWGLMDSPPFVTTWDNGDGIPHAALRTTVAMFERKDLDDQLPYGDFTPGRYAWLLEDVQPVERRCPACWEVRVAPGPHQWWAGLELCPRCGGKNSCEPIPAKGRQGLWEWGAA